MTMGTRGKFILPNVFTSLNFLIGVWAVLWAAGAFTSSDQENIYAPFKMAAHFVVFCVLLDKLDGFAARIMNASSEFGAQFDSLADLVAFGIAPAFAIFFAYKGLAPDWFASHTPMLVVAMSVYVLAAAMRLAKYNAMDSDSYPDYFIGMPSTFAGGLNAIVLILLCEYNFFDGDSRFFHLPIVLMVGTAILMVSPLFLPKLKKRKSRLINILQLVNIIGTYIAGFSMQFSEYLLAQIVLYAGVGFAYGVIHKDEIIADQDAKTKSALDPTSQILP